MREKSHVRCRQYLCVKYLRPQIAWELGKMVEAGEVEF
jgi:hypothetical protein